MPDICRKNILYVAPTSFRYKPRNSESQPYKSIAHAVKKAKNKKLREVEMYL